jgi:DNA transformation protein
MPASDEYADYLRDLLRPLGVIRLRRMFGGYGIYADELFFAVVIDGQLYFKVDAVTRPQFEAASLEEWVYEKEGKPVHMNYFRPPEEIFDEEEALRDWGRLALAAALRARKPARKAAGPQAVVEKTAVKEASAKKTRKKTAVKKTAAKKTQTATRRRSP